MSTEKDFSPLNDEQAEQVAGGSLGFETVAVERCHWYVNDLMMTDTLRVYYMCLEASDTGIARFKSCRYITVPGFGAHWSAGPETRMPTYGMTEVDAPISAMELINIGFFN